MTGQQDRILVVDDDPSIREVIIAVLCDEGFDAMGAEDGLAALEALRSNEVKPSLILLDLMMPNMSGPEFLAHQRNDPTFGIPVVLLSADPAVVEKGVELGATEAICKPIKLDALLEVARRYAHAKGEG